MKFDDAKTALTRTKKQPPGGAALGINKLHRECCAGMRTTLEKAIEIGKRLTAQKKKCGHGHWLPWIKANLEFSHDVAADYMRCFGNRRNFASERNLTISDFARFVADPPPADGHRRANLLTDKTSLSERQVAESLHSAVDEARSYLSKQVAESLHSAIDETRSYAAEPRPRPVAGEFKLVDAPAPQLREVDELIFLLEDVIRALKKLSVDWNGYAPEDAERLRALVTSIAASATESLARES